ncbi:MAG: inosine/xanthosine triphosphatase [Pyrodictiaceae archaeon]
MSTCRVAVGSRNPVKLKAVKRAFRELCNPTLVSVDVNPGVPRQPIGICQVLEGALNRALASLEHTGTDYSVGIEAGIIEYHGVIDLEAQVAIVISREGEAGVGASPAFMLPTGWLKMMKEGVELEEIAEKTIGFQRIGENIGLIGYLSNGLITRTDLTYYAVLMAILPWINRKLYKPLSLEELEYKVRNCESFGGK